MPAFGHDLRYAVRLLRRAPGFTAVAVATLALGIGATTAIFSIVDSVLLRPLPFVEPQRLTMVRPTSGARLSPSYFNEWRLESRSFDDMAAWHDVRLNLTGSGEPVEVLVDRVTPNFFDVLGTPALAGRTFLSGTALSNAAPEVVLSYGFWQRRFGGDAGVVGRAIVLDGGTFVVVGVMPRGFAIRTTELAESRTDMWMPFRLVIGDPVGMGGMLHVVGRLAPRVTSDRAQAELALIAHRIEEAHPSYSRDWRVQVIPLHDATVQDVRLTLLVLFGAVALLLLIACANVANLVLSRTAARQAEVAIRSSLGATRARLVRQLLTESMVVAAAGGALGVLLAVWGTGFVVSVIPAGLDIPRMREIAVDRRILAFACLVTTLTAVVFGLAPAISSARSRSVALRDGTRGSSSGPGRYPGSMLVVCQVALAVILLAGAGLLARSFRALTLVEPGFEPERVLTVRTTLPESRYGSDDRIRSFGRELLTRMGGHPGVRAIGFASYLPMSRFGMADVFEIEGRPSARPDDRPASWVNVVGGDYFEAMGIPLLRGRLPGVADAEDTPHVFVIDEEMARRFWPDDDPIGVRLAWQKDGATVSGEIVGVVGSVRWRGMAAERDATTYSWFPQDPGRDFAIVIRTTGNPAAMASLVSAAVKEIDPGQPVADVRSMDDVVSADLARPRFSMFVLGGFAVTALLLASVGLYGVIAVLVTQRTREIGIRLALGARRRDVLQMVMRRGMRLAGAGLAIGIAGALALGRLVSGLLFGIAPSDPATLLAVALFLSAVAMLATYVPARKAAGLDPMVALKAE